LIGSCVPRCALYRPGQRLEWRFKNYASARAFRRFFKRRFRNTGPASAIGTPSSHKIRLKPLPHLRNSGHSGPGPNMFDDSNSDVTPLPMRPASGVEFIFLGTGTSGSLPNVSCLTAPEGEPPCKTCLSTLNPEGKKNIRRNTSGVLRIEGRDGKTRYVLQPQSMPKCVTQLRRTSGLLSSMSARTSKQRQWNGSQSMDYEESMPC
jgi:hypothetical protein